MPHQNQPDTEFVFYVHPSEGPNFIVIAPPLDGSNYLAWSRSMIRAFGAKNKLKFIDDLNRSAWERCTHLIQSWIINSVSPQIAQTLVFHENAIDAWSELKERYVKVDIIRIATLPSKINNLKQGSKTVLEYFTKMKTLWEELNSHRPMPHCTCPHPCRCAATREARNYRLEDLVIQFLTSLNDQFNVVKTKVLMLDPLPSINKVYSLVVQEESNNHSLSSPFDEQLSVINAAESQGIGQGRGRGYYNNFRPPIHCSFCRKSNHTIDFRYQKHGQPNFQKQGSSADVSRSTDEVEAQSRSSNEAPTIFGSTISQEKYDQLVSFLQQVNLLPTAASPTSANQIHAPSSSTSFNPSGISSIFSCSIQSETDLAFRFWCQ